MVKIAHLRPFEGYVVGGFQQDLVVEGIYQLVPEEHHPLEYKHGIRWHLNPR